MLQIILKQITDPDRLLIDMTKSIEALNRKIGSLSRSLQLIKTLMIFEVPQLHPNNLLGIPIDTRDNTNNC